MGISQTSKYDVPLNILAVIVIACIVIVFLLCVIVPRQRNNQSRAASRTVTVVDLKESASGNAMQGIISRNAGPLTQTHEKYKVTIQSGDGDRKDFYVDEKTFRSVRIGQKGLLKTQGERWVSFK